MRPQTLAVVLLALGSGLAAVWAVRSTLKKPAAPVEETVPAIVAKVDLRRDEPIEEAMVEVRKVPKSQAPAGALASIEDAASRTPSIPMLAGEFVIEPKLLPKGSRPGMASMIKPGMRAFTIMTPTFSSSLAGFLQPGNRVDVLLTVGQPGGPGADGAKTTVLLQNIELLAVHTMVEASPENRANPTESRSVTLSVTPKQASILDLAQDKGTLHLALRNPKDESDAEEATATLADLGLDRPAPPVPPIKEDRARAAGMIRPGMRALTILTPSFSASLAGLLQPGDRVDVLLTITPPGADEEHGSTTKPLLQNIELLAAHTKVETPNNPKPLVAPDPTAGGNYKDPAECPSVTLLVTPKQASILDLAQIKGTLHLSLRGKDEELETTDLAATIDDLCPPPPRLVAAAPEPPPVVLSVRTLRGTYAGRDSIAVLRRDSDPARGTVGPTLVPVPIPIPVPAPPRRPAPPPPGNVVFHAKD